MKILFIGSTKSSACSLHYYTSLVRLGHAVLPFDPDYFRASNRWEQLQIKLRKGPLPKRIQQVSQELIGLCRQNRFDLVFVMSENFLGQETISEMRTLNGGALKFIYHSHDNNFSKGICKPDDFFATLATYDFAFTTKSQNVARYQKLGQQNAYFIPSAYEPMVHHPVSKSHSYYRSQDLKVTFVGTYDRSRDPILNAIGWKHLKVWGSHWKKSPSYATHAAHIHAHPIYYFEFADILSHSQCSLGLLRKEAEDQHTQRTFEIPACGSLQITPRTEEILSFFEEDKEIVCFESPEELKEKTQFYLENPTARQKIAQAGHARCLQGGHTYVDRVQKMLEFSTRD